MSGTQKGSVSTLDKLFNILNLINGSEVALSSYDVADITGYNQRTVLRYLTRLTKERLVGFKVKVEEVTYDYNRKEDNKVFTASRPTRTFEYYRLGESYGFSRVL